MNESIVRGTGSMTEGALSPLSQLQLFEAKYDPVSRAVVEDLPLGDDPRCLEIGAGAGSMARWIADHAGDGPVLALDADVTHLDAAGRANLRVHEQDVVEASYAPGSFDLVFARATLGLIPQREDVLTRAASWLARGGWLVVEDFYYLPPPDSPTAVGRVMIDGYLRRLTELGFDPAWARRLPSSLRAAGLTDVRTRITPAGPGITEMDNRLIGLRMAQEGNELVEHGLVSADDLEFFVDALGAGELWDLSTVAVSAAGRRPDETGPERSTS